MVNGDSDELVQIIRISANQPPEKADGKTHSKVLDGLIDYSEGYHLQHFIRHGVLPRDKVGHLAHLPIRFYSGSAKGWSKDGVKDND
jgi:hypothetical protein